MSDNARIPKPRFGKTLALCFGIASLVYMLPFYTFILDNKNQTIWQTANLDLYLVVVLHLLPALALALAVRAVAGLSPTTGRKAETALLMIPVVFFAFWGSGKLFGSLDAFPLWTSFWEVAEFQPIPFALWFTGSLFLAIVIGRVVADHPVPARTFFATVGYLSIAYIAWFLYATWTPPDTKEYRISGNPITTAPADFAKGHPPTLVIVYDEFPLATLLDEHGEVSKRFPAFRQLANESIWFKNAATHYDYTAYSVYSMLAGRLVETDNDRVDGDKFRHEPNLFTLSAARYRPELLVSWVRYCFGKVDFPCTGEEQYYPRNLLDFSRFSLRHPVEYSMFHFMYFLNVTGFLPLDVRTDLMPSFVPYIRWHNDLLLKLADEKNLDGRLIYHHSFLPHEPYLMAEDGGPSDPALPHTFRSMVGRELRIHPAYRKYIDQLRYTDRILGEVIRRLKKNGNWDKINFVVTADHGIEYMGNFRGRLFGGITDHIAFVPLFVKPAGTIKGRIDDRRYQHIDFLPTLLDMMNLKKPDGLPGRSVFDAPPNRPYLAHGGDQHDSDTWWTKQNPSGLWQRTKKPY